MFVSHKENLVIVLFYCDTETCDSFTLVTINYYRNPLSKGNHRDLIYSFCVEAIIVGMLPVHSFEG